MESSRVKPPQQQSPPATAAVWELIAANCTGCGICTDVCSYAAIKMTRAMAYPEPVPGLCVSCMACVEECPFAAIEVRSLPNQ